MNHGSHDLFLYNSPAHFAERMSTAVASGIAAADLVVLVASREQLRSVTANLRLAGVDLESVKARETFIEMDAAKLASELLVNNWPSEERGRQFLESLAGKAGETSRRVRLIGEMGPIIMDKSPMAAVAMEEFFQKAVDEFGFDLLCTYPEEVFENRQPFFHAICAAHSKVIRG